MYSIYDDHFKTKTFVLFVIVNKIILKSRGIIGAKVANNLKVRATYSNGYPNIYFEIQRYLCITHIYGQGRANEILSMGDVFLHVIFLLFFFCQSANSSETKQLRITLVSFNSSLPEDVFYKGILNFQIYTFNNNFLKIYMDSTVVYA